jgi:hypothetical protein
MKLRARYSIDVRERIDATRTIAAIRDDGGNAGFMSVTNDAEAVIADLHAKGEAGPGVRVLYCDTDGRWDELCHDGAGRFTGFRPGAASLGKAISKIRQEQA